LHKVALENIPWRGKNILGKGQIYVLGGIYSTKYNKITIQKTSGGKIAAWKEGLRPLAPLVAGLINKLSSSNTICF